jgi:hypothetical protein
MAKSPTKKLPFLEFLFLLVFVLCLGVGLMFMYTNQSVPQTSAQAHQSR